MSEDKCFLRSGAEDRAPKQGEFKADGLAEGDMPVAFHEADHKTMPENRQDTDENLVTAALIGQRLSPMR
ncbi:MAG: hypothetical protein RLO15_19680 [Parvibaculum sp.]